MCCCIYEMYCGLFEKPTNTATKKKFAFNGQRNEVVLCYIITLFLYTEFCELYPSRIPDFFPADDACLCFHSSSLLCITLSAWSWLEKCAHTKLTEQRNHKKRCFMFIFGSFSLALCRKKNYFIIISLALCVVFIVSVSVCCTRKGLVHSTLYKIRIWLF